MTAKEDLQRLWARTWPGAAEMQKKLSNLPDLRQEYQGSWDSLEKIIEGHQATCEKCRRGRHCHKYNEMRGLHD